MTQNEVLEAAREISHLQNIEITYGSNGYPKGLGEHGVIGFYDMQEAQDFAAFYGCEVKEFTSKDGWQFWNEGGVRSDPYSYIDYVNKLGDDYELANESDEQYNEWIRDIVNGSYVFLDYLKSAINNINEIKMKVDHAKNGEKVIIYNGKYYETVAGTMMNYSEDTNLYAIGVFVPHNLK